MLCLGTYRVMPTLSPGAERLTAACATVAAGTDRRLFEELNPDLPHAPIMKEPPTRPRPASVLIPVLAREDEPSVLFTVRAPTMPSHAGEISFPGGGPKDGDTDEISTALREAYEEVGLPPSAVEVAGRFGIHYGGMGYAVTPVVGFVAEPPAFAPCTREVDEVFEVPLAHFLDLDNHGIFVRTFRGADFRMFRVPYKDDHQDRNIWGLTAGILQTLAFAWHDLPVKAER